MSREIKFRVWSEEDREYRTDCRLTELFTSETGTPATAYSDEGDRFDIEQYTGLKDKNGKEIYEGDIVDTGEKYGKYKVVFSEFWCGFSFEGGKGRKTRGGTEYPRFSQDWDSVEVIGNIHENPELLEGEK